MFGSKTLGDYEQSLIKFKEIFKGNDKFIIESKKTILSLRDQCVQDGVILANTIRYTS